MTNPDELSPREQEVVQQLLAGKSNKMIASALHISESTVEFHLKNIYTRLGVRSRTELILKLGKSTVAGRADFAENGDGSQLRKWLNDLRRTVQNIRKGMGMENSLNENDRNSGGAMTFFESIRTCLLKYADFTGRASRPELWWFLLFVLLVASALTYLSETAASIFLIAVLLPLLAAGARRLRDSGQSPWWLLLLLVPVGGVVALGFLWARPGVEEG
jgi:DNA-binding CsgD family transcriptional regulator